MAKIDLKSNIKKSPQAPHVPPNWLQVSIYTNSV